MNTKPKFKVTDKVFVIDWGNQYSKIGGGVGVFQWKTEIPPYSSTDHFWKREYEDNLTVKGTINKREPKKLKSRTPVWKNFQYEVIEFQYHPNKEDGYTKKPIYLIASKPNEIGDRCFVEIEEDGLSILTEEQYDMEKFEGLKEYHKGKWSHTDNLKNFPEELTEICYDKNDNVLFGSSYTKGKVMYKFIPEQYMKTKVPFIINVSISYDGKGNSDLPESSMLMHYNELKTVFKDNIFQ